MQHQNLNIYFIGILLLISEIGNAQIDGNYTWFGNNHFQIKENNNTTNIKVNKKPWEAFTLYINELDLSKNPFLTFEIKTDKVIDLRIDMVDASNDNKTQSPISKRIIPLDNFMVLEYDFSDFISQIDGTKITHFQFFVQPDLEHQGNIEIRNITFDQETTSNFPNPSKISILSNPKSNEVIIQSNNKEFDQIKIYNALGILTYHQNLTPTFLEKLNIHAFSSGVYFLEVFAKNKSIQAGSFVR